MQSAKNALIDHISIKRNDLDKEGVNVCFSRIFWTALYLNVPNCVFFNIFWSIYEKYKIFIVQPFSTFSQHNYIFCIHTRISITDDSSIEAPKHKSLIAQMKFNSLRQYPSKDCSIHAALIILFINPSLFRIGSQRQYEWNIAFMYKNHKNYV